MNMPNKKKVWSLHNVYSQVTYKSVIWWVLLIVAVLVVPSIAILFTTMTYASGTSETVIFITACLVCVGIGLRLMKSTRMAPIMFESITLSEALKERCINKIGVIETQTAQWKTRYTQCESVFMNVSRQPAWDYFDEVTQIMCRIKHTAETASTIAYSDIKSLHSWMEGGKPMVLAGYLKTLDAAYEYFKAEYAQHGTNCEESFPELSDGNIGLFIAIPSYSTIFGRELLDAIKQEHPFLGTTEWLQGSNVAK